MTAAWADVAGIAPHRSVRVRFPCRQLGASSSIGFCQLGGAAHVLKILRTVEARSWADSMSLQHPRYARLMGRAPVHESAFAPTAQSWPKIEANNETCCRWLSEVSREQAADALGSLDNRSDEGRHRQLTEELFAGRRTISFAPAVSRPLKVDILPGGPSGLLALLQEDVGGESGCAMPFSLHVRAGRRLISPRERRAQFVLLGALALSLARAEGVGLDLTPRFVLKGGARVTVPNVVESTESKRLVFVDFFGLARPDGNLIESAAFRAGYGAHGLLRPLLARLYREVSRR